MGRDCRNFRDIFDDVAVTIFAHQPTPGLTGQLSIKAFLDSLDPLIIDVGKAQQVSGNVSSGIKATRLIAQIDTRQAQLVDPLCLLRIYLAREIEKARVRMRLHAMSQLAKVEM